VKLTPYPLAVGVIAADGSPGTAIPPQRYSSNITHIRHEANRKSSSSPLTASGTRTYGKRLRHSGPTPIIRYSPRPLISAAAGKSARTGSTPAPAPASPAANSRPAEISRVTGDADRVTTDAQADHDVDVLRAELPASLTSARQARSAVRRALATWGVHDPSGDAELLASELVANAAEHASGPISLAVRRHAEPDGRGASPARSPTPHPACPGPGRPGRTTNAAAAWRVRRPLAES
jgi:hypothetical protein